MAKITKDSELSGESAVRETVKERLVEQGREKRSFFRLPQVSRGTFATGFGLTVLLAAPFVFDMISKEKPSIHMGFSTNGGSLFPDVDTPSKGRKYFYKILVAAVAIALVQKQNNLAIKNPKG